MHLKLSRTTGLVLLLVSAGFSAKAQNGNMNPGQASPSTPLNTYLNNFVQPPPNAASLGKYADYPVGYYTGVPEISVPIYNLKDGGISLPISLSYHASGIHVSELASWVGLGWALNANGMISRTVRGGPDEGGLKGGIKPYAPNGYYTDYGLFGLTQIMPYKGPDNGFTDQNGVLAASNVFYGQVTQAMMAGQADCEPDLYTFNVNGHSGKFVFDEKRNVRLLEDDNIKIKENFDPVASRFKSWVITTDDGIQYYFGENSIQERVIPVTNGNMPDPNSALPANWFLTHIINPNTKDTVTFNYVPEVYSYFDLGPESQVYGGQGASSQNLLSNAWNTGNLSLGGYVANFITTNVVGVKLASIVSKNYTIKFIAVNPRQDLMQTYSGNCFTCASVANNSTLPAASLDTIKIYTNADGNCVRQFALTHSYFQSSSNTTTAVLNTIGYLSDTYRLKLGGVTEISGDGTLQKPSYSFTYQESVPLPRRLSYDQDHWGFSNNQGGANNPFFTPALNNPVPFNVTYGANRHPKWPDMSGFVLTNIQDPLGVVTTFTYGPNSANNYIDPQNSQADTLIGGLRIQQIKVTDNVTGKSRYRNFNYYSPGGTLPGGMVTHVPVYMFPIKNYYFSYAVATLIGQTFPSNALGGYIGAQYYSGFYQLMRQSSSIVPMQDANGNHIVYPYVKEIFGAHGEGGYKTYTFNTREANPTDPQINSRLAFSNYTASVLEPTTNLNNAGQPDSAMETIGNGHMNDTLAWPKIRPDSLVYSPDYNEIENSYPLVPEQVDLISSKLVEEDTFDALGNPVTSITNNYSQRPKFHENYWIRGMSAYLPMATFAFPYNALAFYKLHTGVSHLISTTKKTYSGTSFVTLTTNYGYESPNHTLKTSDTTTDSQGNILINKTYYSWDYANSATTDNIFGKMKARHLLEPVDVENWRNGNLVGERVTKYFDFAAGAPDTLINPINIYNLEIATPFTPAQAGESQTWAAPVSTLLPNTSLANKVNFTFDGVTGKMISQELTHDKFQGIQWSSKLKMPVALADNARHTAGLNEFYFEGFEESTTTGLYAGTGHTGTHCVFAPYTVDWTLPANGRSYVITYWYLLNGVWTLQPEQPFTGTLALTGGTAYDDIRIYPTDALVVTYTYDADGNVTSTTDAKNLSTYYEYDSFQRLKNIRDYKNNIVKSYCYNYAGQANGCYIAQPTYTSAAQSRLFNRQCSGDSSGSQVNYQVAAGAYNSGISTQDANNKATADRDGNGQNYANITGYCTINTTFLASNSTSDDYTLSITAGTINISVSVPAHTLNLVVNSIPIGNYSISFYPTGSYNGIYHTFNLTGQATQSSTPRADYTGIQLTAGVQLSLTVQP